MSYYEAQSWQLPVRQATWDQPPPPPSRSGTINQTSLKQGVGSDGYAGTTSVMQNEDIAAFDTQIEGVWMVLMGGREAVFNFCTPPVVINDTGLYRKFRNPPRPKT